MAANGKSLEKTVSLTPLDEAFCHAFIINWNAAKAYKRVKPDVADGSAKELGHRMLTRVDIKDRIEELRQAQLERYRISADRVLQEISLLAFQNAADYGEWDEKGRLVLDASSELPYHLKACIKSIEQDTRRYFDPDGNPIEEHKLKLTFHSKERALEMLGKHLNLFQDANNAPVVVNFNIQNFERSKPVQYAEAEVSDE
jgi:hypothetical protein